MNVVTISLITGVGSMSEWPMAAVVLVLGTFTIINSISTQFSTAVDGRSKGERSFTHTEMVEMVEILI
jgi:hypothetical protein